MGRAWTCSTAAAFVLFAGAAAADTTAPQLVSLAVSPTTFDTSSGPVLLTVSITALDSGGFNSVSAGSGILLVHQSGSAVFGRQNLSVTGGSLTNPIFQFTVTIPQFSPPGAYRIAVTLADAAQNSRTYSSSDLQALGLPSSVTAQPGGGSITLSPSTATSPAAGGSGTTQVAASSAGVSWSAVSNAPWLTITSGASGVGNGTIQYLVAQNNAPASRTGAITVNGQSFTMIQAAAGASLNTTAVALQFAYQIGSAAPAPKTLTAFSSGASLNFTATATSAGNWLFVSPTSGVTSTILSVWVDPTGLAPGTYNGLVTVAGAGSANGSVSAAVNLVVSSGSDFTISPTSLSFSSQGGSVPAPRTVSIIGGAGSFAASSSSSGWLAVTPFVSSNSSSFSVSVFPAGLGIGTYTGSVTFSSTSSGFFQTLPVTLVITSGPPLAVTPASLTFTHIIGASTPPAQSLSITGTAAGVSLTASGGGWLILGASTGTIPGAVAVSVNPSGLTQGVYSGAVTVTTDAPPATQQIPVTLVVTRPSVTVVPSSLTFSYREGGALPASQILNVDSSTATGLTFAATASSAGGWLAATPGAGITPGQVSVAVTGAALAAGAYTGTVVVSVAGASATVQTIPVSLTVEPATGLSVTPSLVEINYQTGDPNPVAPALSVSNGSAPANFTASASSSGNWLTVSPSSGFTPATLTMQINPAGLEPGSYTGTILIASAGQTTRVVTVSLGVRAPQNLTVSAGSLSFAYQAGGPPPASQTLTLGCTGSALSFRATAASVGNWLTTTVPSGIANNQLIVSVNPAGLPAGSYSGTITLFGEGACNRSQSLPVTLVVSAAASTLTVGPESLSFSYAGAAAPAGQSVSIGCGTAASAFSAVASSSGGWLTVNPAAGTTPSTLNVSVLTAGLATGSYSGSISIAASGACSGSRTVLVTLVVSAAASTLTVGPESLSFSYAAGATAPAAQSVSIGCGTAASAFSAVASSSGGWLTVNPAAGNTPSTLNVSVLTAGLATGSYSGSISIAASGACSGSRTVTVSLVVTGAPGGAPQPPAPQPPVTSALAFGGASLAFTVAAGSTSAASQTVSLDCGGALAPFTVSASSSWLLVIPVSGNTPATITASVNSAGLAPGSYTASITATSSACGSASPLPVTLTVTQSAALSSLAINPSSLAFNYLIGDATPPGQTLAVTGAGQSFTVSASSSVGWLLASPLTATAPATVNVSVNPAGLTPGAYWGVLTLASIAGSSGASQNVGVTLNVSGTPPPAPITSPAPAASPPRISSLVNAASLLSSPLAAGEIISIFGSELGPVDQETLRLGPANLVDSVLGGTRVIINGKAAPILFTSGAQVNTIVPYSVAGRSTVQLQLEYQGVRSAIATFSVAEAAPAIFSIDGSGRGQAALLNQDSSVNSNLNPADRGSIAVLYASGAGVMAPASEDGSITGTTLARPVLPVSVLVDGQDAVVTYAGAAPGLVAGVLQVNFRLPPQVRTGAAVGLLLKVGRFTSQAGLTLAIR